MSSKIVLRRRKHDCHWRRHNKLKKLVSITKDTNIILETDSSAAKAHAERPGCGRISVKYRCLQDAITNNEAWLRKVGTKHNVADGLTKTVNQQMLRNMLTTENRAKSIQNELMGEQKSTPTARGVNPSTGHMSILMHCGKDKKSSTLVQEH